MVDILKIAITGAAGDIGYALLGMLGRGRVFGKCQKIQLNIFDFPEQQSVLELSPTSCQRCGSNADLAVAFKDAKAAFLLGSCKPKDMECNDQVFNNFNFFKEQGKALEKCANKNVRVLVADNPFAMAMVCSCYAPSIPKTNFTALSRLDQNRATYQIAKKIGVHSSDVRNIVVFGNNSPTVVPFAGFACAKIQDRFSPVKEMFPDSYFDNELRKLVANRNQEILAKKKSPPALSVAKAACDHMHDWWHGIRTGEFISMGVPSKGSYCVPEDVVFSFPVVIDNKKNYCIVEAANLLENKVETTKNIAISTEELESEQNEIMAFVDKKPYKPCPAYESKILEGFELLDPSKYKKIKKDMEEIKDDEESDSSNKC
uniref:Malate dehydrogenase, cytoplasmic n=1 Tax=Megaselia scalaris TaxID=36166 RepID=T1GSB8_MEGSC